MNKKDKSKIIDNEKYNFFRDIRRLKKVPHVYIDEYTKRENFNQKNNEINKAVSTKKLGVKQMNKTIEDYFTKPDIFLTTYISPTNYTNRNQDDKEKISRNLYDPKYSLEYLKPKPMNIFTKTEKKIERNNIKINRQSIDDDYRSFMIRKQDFLDGQTTNKNTNYSKSLENFSEKNLTENLEKKSISVTFNKNMNDLIPVKEKQKEKIYETLTKIVNANKLVRLSPYCDDISNLNIINKQIFHY